MKSCMGKQWFPTSRQANMWLGILRTSFSQAADTELYSVLNNLSTTVEKMIFSSVLIWLIIHLGCSVPGRRSMQLMALESNAAKGCLVRRWQEAQFFRWELGHWQPIPVSLPLPPVKNRQRTRNGLALQEKHLVSNPKCLAVQFSHPDLRLWFAFWDTSISPAHLWVLKYLKLYICSSWKTLRRGRREAGRKDDLIQDA